MKKQLESELISIAHKILKLTGREDLGKMQTEIALLYQKITILKFIEGHHEGQLPASIESDPSFFESLEPVVDSYETNEGLEEKELEAEQDPDKIEEITQPVIEITKNEAPQKHEETEAKTTKHDLSELSPGYTQLPIFDAIEEKTQLKPLNNQLKPQGFQIGLNDRLAFVKSLFENSNEDYERVLSQLSTLDSYEEAANLVDSIIKPDYHNWKGQEEIEARFLEILENKFK
ncbi:hypothetical protein N9H82_02290 [Flavobacteriaceae bacterium]|jgi:hypothetical protein|nr:hypothetical protein [Flavobacteriaceae bacterium]|tara:strand:- start:736 stop:1431 length:696 start_codon:yes stop_codon:yes gene_type:complete